jgi:hypothetical protein
MIIDAIVTRATCIFKPLLNSIKKTKTKKEKLKWF